MDVDEDARMIGRQVRLIRRSQRKSLEVIAGLAGMSKSELSRIELGQRALDRHSKIVALANALQVAPSELTDVDLPALDPGESEAVQAVRRALTAVSRHRPGGQVLAVDEVRSRVRAVLEAKRQCQWVEVGAALPGLIRDVHSSIAAGRGVAELLELAVMLHVPGTAGWLAVMGAGVELRSLATLVARQAAEHHEDPSMLGLAVWGDGMALLADGEFDLARAELEAVTVPTNTPEQMQLAGMLALGRSLVAAADQRPAELLGRSRQATYWKDYGRALARLRKRHNDAVLALRRSETLYAPRMQRNPFVREVLGELVVRCRRDTPIGRELWGMAYRAGLPV